VAANPDWEDAGYCGPTCPEICAAPCNPPDEEQLELPFVFARPVGEVEGDGLGHKNKHA
jgi:hypothetical protein